MTAHRLSDRIVYFVGPYRITCLSNRTTSYIYVHDRDTEAEIISRPWVRSAVRRMRASEIVTWVGEKARRRLPMLAEHCERASGRVFGGQP